MSTHSFIVSYGYDILIEILYTIMLYTILYLRCDHLAISQPWANVAGLYALASSEQVV